jgi:hypothetical protein
MTFRPSFHWPRFLSSSTRSKRFRTLRLATMVLAPLRLRCCDINWKMSAQANANLTIFKCQLCRALQLVRQDDVRP